MLLQINKCHTPIVNARHERDRPWRIKLLMFFRLLVEQLPHSISQILRLMSLLATLPLPSIPHTPNLPRQPNSTALRNARILTPLHTLLQQLRAPSLITDTSIQLLKIDPVLQRAILHQIPLGNLLILHRHAVAEPQTPLRVVREQFVGA